MSPLPVEPFRYYQHGNRTVHLDGWLEVGGADYRAPPELLGHLVPVQWDARCVRLICPAINPGDQTRDVLIERLRT